MQLSDSAGRVVQLGPRIAEGGEGAVFEVSGRPTLVAKVYHANRQPDAQKAAKLAAMTSVQTEQLQKLSAWPVDVLHASPGGSVRGLLMPRLAGFKELHSLYTPRSRLTEFPNATLQFLLHTARNTAIAFHAIHQHGHIVGDVNHGNLFVGSDAIVRLIDCDSFQITAGSKIFLCEVGVSTHTPPELQGMSFSSVTRTANHDAFGLAVLIFQLVFLGRHPFSGRYHGRGEMPLETAIKEHRFAYSAKAKALLMEPPPGGLTLASVHPAVRALFERAFGHDGERPGARPTAEEWIRVLGVFESELTKCGAHAGHSYWRGEATCPWCAFEALSGRIMFNIPLVGPGSGAPFDLATLMREVAAIDQPLREPVPDQRPAANPEPRFVEGGKGRWARRAVAFAVAVMICGGLAALPDVKKYALIVLLLAALSFWLIERSGPRRALRSEAREIYNKAREELKQLQKKWPDPELSRFSQLKNAFTEASTAHTKLPETHAAKIRELESKRRELQLEAWLNAHRVCHAKAKGVGDSKKATLQSYGIDTAADISSYRIQNIPGFGPKTADALVAWRRSVEMRFQFDPRKGADMTQIRKIDAEMRASKLQLETKMRNHSAELRLISQRYREQREALRPKLIFALAAEAQAKANFNACR